MRFPVFPGRVTGEGNLDSDDIVRILVVDGDPDAADLYRRILAHKMPVEVERAADVATARRRLSDSGFDVVTIDNKLPDESGLILLEDLVEGEDNPPVIVVTDSGDVHLATRSFDMGAAGYVIKDYKLPETLATVIESALAKAALKRAGDALNRENAFTGVAVNALEEVFMVLDLEGRFMSWNKRLKELTGFTDRELHRMDCARVFIREEAERFMGMTRALDRGEKAVLRLRVAAADGRRVPYELTAVMLKDAMDEPVGICAIGHEVSWHRKVIPTAVKGREVAELTGEIIARVDYDGMYTYLNDAACWFWGMPREKLIGHSFTEFIHSEDIEQSVDSSSFTLRTGRMVKGLINRQKTPRGERQVEWNVMPVLGEDGVIAGFQFTGRDVTERILSEQFLVRANRELDAYAHTVSHDLRGPLSAIMLAADTMAILLERDDLDAVPNGTLLDMARIISMQTREAGSMVEDLLQLAESGQVPRVIEEVDVGEVVRDVLAKYESEISEKGVAVRLSKEMGRISGSRMQVFQVFSNLIGNAMAHNDSSEPAVEVTCLGEEEGGHRYVVRDNGSGVPPEDLEHIFELFFKGERGGAGIGLATVEKIVKVYGGFVRVYNDGGACFEVCLKDIDGNPGPGPTP